MEELLTSAGIISMISLTFMEVILGIDNIIFISIIAGRVEKKDQTRARNLGLILAMVIRVALLFVIQIIIDSQKTLFKIPLDFAGNEISIKDLVLMAGGLFLIYKSTTEIHHKFNVDDHKEAESKTKKKFNAVVFQILMLNIVFSVDSIVTAIGLTQNIAIMMIAVVLSMIIMLAVSSSISNFVEKHPSVKMLALAFLLMIGFMLMIESFDIHINKGFIYFAMAFSLFVEMLNIRYKRKREMYK